MRLYLLLSSLLALTISFVSGTALTYKLNGNEKSCFFTDVQRQNAKVAFYFAVCIGLYNSRRYFLTLWLTPSNCRYNPVANLKLTTKSWDPMTRSS